MAASSWNKHYKNTPSLKHISILMVDSDHSMIRLVGYFLRSMGFETMHFAKTASQAMEILRNRPVDLVITEWLLEPMSGIDLVRSIRNDSSIPNRTMPVVMLTGKGEAVDVRSARDAGITEFLLKPFSAQTLYGHIEQVIERPRSFVLCDVYVGPERRRRKNAEEEDNSERRIFVPEVMPTPQIPANPVAKSTIILPPNFIIKDRIGLQGSTTLSTIITPEILQKAQAVTETLSSEALDWLRQDMSSLEQRYETMTGAPNARTRDAFRMAALAIKSRAGTFGYSYATEIANQLYLFLGDGFTANSSYHQMIAHKHIEVLRATFGTGIKTADKVGIELKHELKRLIEL